MRSKLKKGIIQVTDSVIALGIIFIVLTAIIIPASVWTVNEYRNMVAAGQARTVQTAVNKYISDNATTISASATETSPFTLTVPMLISANYLPAGYSSMNNFSATYQTKILQPGTGKFHVMTFLTGGVELNLSQARNIATKIGASGGYIEGGIAKGALGAWSENLSVFGGFNPGDGHIVIAGFYQNGAISNDYLYRKAVPGHPELNTMSTALNMGGNDVNNVIILSAKRAEISEAVTTDTLMASGKITSSDIVQGKYFYPSEQVILGATCSPNGAISHIGTGEAVSCVNGKWSKNSGVPVGTITLWGSSTLPADWMELNGQSFNKSTFPELAALYPSLRLPDFRGRFVRALDHGAGVDSDKNRVILSLQDDAIRNIKGRFSADNNNGGYPLQVSGAFNDLGGISNGDTGDQSLKEVRLYEFDASRVVPTDVENRPKNIAVMYIIKAR